MTPSVQTLAAIALGIILGVAGIALVVFMVRRAHRHGLAESSTTEAANGPNIALEERLAPLMSVDMRRSSIVEQLPAVERFTKRRMSEFMAAMVDSSGWQTLVKQLEELSEERIVYLRVLANRAGSGLVPEDALRHTLKVYSLTELMLAIDRQLIAQSDVVSQVLDDWFHSHRGVSLAEFEARLHLDAARILLLDLDYACPPVDAALRQLSLAEEHCKAARLPGEPATDPSNQLLFEIGLRQQRLQPRA